MSVWTAPCQQPHPILLKWLDARNVPFWRELVAKHGTINPKGSLGQCMNYARNTREIAEGKPPALRHEPDVGVLNSEWFLKFAVVGALRKHDTDPQVVALVDEFNHRILPDDSRKSAEAANELAEKLDKELAMDEVDRAKGKDRGGHGRSGDAGHQHLYN